MNKLKQIINSYRNDGTDPIKPDSLFVDSGKHTLSLDLKNAKRKTT